MAPKQQPCAKYQYVVTSAGPKILPVDEPSCKDEESPADYNSGGYLPVKVNDTFKQGRYRVVRKLGWGHFSTVWLVKDSYTQAHSAIKVVKSAGRYAETARDEIKLLSQVSSFSPTHPGRAHIVSFLDSFQHQGPESSHICIIFEPLGENLLALIERNKKKGVPRPLVKIIAKQILLGLQYLHDECDLVHTDIKPENILISIPDVESHIQNELSQSPSPTSRRVGVPLPTKSRAGVSIPYSQQRARRQVQIFDSQPLASPGRSVGRSANGHSSMSLSTRAGDPAAGPNSQNNSYVAQMHLPKMIANGASLSSYSSVSGAVPGSSAPKVPSNLSTSYPHSEVAPGAPGKPSTELPPRPIATFISASSSSSLSSISSALASATAGSGSIVSTPPTSLSHSLTSAVAGFVGTSPMPIEIRSRHPFFSSLEEKEKKERQNLSTLGKSIDDQIENQYGPSPISSSWKFDSAGSTPWADKLSTSLSSSQKSKSSLLKSSKPRASGIYGHSRSHSGISSATWKDPGTAALAPAVLVNAVVGADGQEGDPLFLRTVSVVNGTSNITISQATSESSSATATAVRPSPVGAPLPGSRRGKALLMNSAGRVEVLDISSNDLTAMDSEISFNISCNAAANHPNPLPSLLTQTAPSRGGAPGSPPPSRAFLSRASPPQQVSQLSAHMHSHRPSGCKYSNDDTDCASTTHNDKHSRTSRNHQPSTATTTPSTTTFMSVTPTPASISPSAPPPTPVASPIIASLIPNVDPVTIPGHKSSLPPLHTSVFHPVSSIPPISIKIADLGNATPSKKHYTEDIQTRQYRAPEAIVGRRDWDARVDIWSVSCVVFELLTAEYLFDPQGQGELFTKDDDHMAQIIELLGDFPIGVKMGGKYSRELFDHTGALRYIRTLKPWPLKRVMTEKYLYSEEDSTALCDFLEPMLALDIKQRVHTRDVVNHSWLNLREDDEIAEW